jgi:hypothetical protein
MKLTEDEFAEILKRPGVKGYESEQGRNVQQGGAQGAKTANANRNTAAPADMEPDIGNEPLGAEKAQGHDSRCCLHVHSIRATLADPDGISAKAAIDGLIHGGILQDDSPRQIQEVTYSQEKCRKGQEKTVITLTW